MQAALSHNSMRFCFPKPDNVVTVVSSNVLYVPKDLEAIK